MRKEKQNLVNQYLAQLNASPFFILLNYQGLKVGPLTELRRRLNQVGAELHVVKNSLFRLAVREAGLPDLGQQLVGQLAVVTGRQDITAAAKIVKKFWAENERPAFRLGYLNNQKLGGAELMALADLPSLEELRAKLLGLLNAPAARLVSILSTPAQQLARVLKMRAEQAG